MFSSIDKHRNRALKLATLFKSRSMIIIFLCTQCFFVYTVLCVCCTLNCLHTKIERKKLKKRPMYVCTGTINQIQSYNYYRGGCCVCVFFRCFYCSPSETIVMRLLSQLSYIIILFRFFISIFFFVVDVVVIIFSCIAAYICSYFIRLFCRAMPIHNPLPKQNSKCNREL